MVLSFLGALALNRVMHIYNHPTSRRPPFPEPLHISPKATFPVRTLSIVRYSLYCTEYPLYLTKWAVMYPFDQSLQAVVDVTKGIFQATQRFVQLIHRYRQEILARDQMIVFLQEQLREATADSQRMGASVHSMQQELERNQATHRQTVAEMQATIAQLRADQLRTARMLEEVTEIALRQAEGNPAHPS